MLTETMKQSSVFLAVRRIAEQSITDPEEDQVLENHECVEPVTTSTLS